MTMAVTTIEEHFDEILEEIAKGGSVRKSCDSRRISEQTFYNYLKTKDEHQEKYNIARERRGESAISRIEEELEKLNAGISDPARARVVIDTLKWFACKFYPKMYGDKQEITHTGSVSVMPSIKIKGKDLDFEIGEKLD